MLPKSERAKRSRRILNGAFGTDARRWALTEFRKTLRPLRNADKLGYALFQLAPWVKRTDEALDRLVSLPRGLPDTTIAVEFRHRSWFGDHTDETLTFSANTT